jgi:tetratricopeptide (TPR) repeat protein/CO dehydrogenase nickel-insertion accessory protein CooC1
MSDSGDGKIVTFYSYKGGTGRTMALANVAWILASNGKRVLAVDWDLESPGLHKFFHPFLDESTVGATPGVIEIINKYQLAALEPDHDLDEWHREYAQVQRHAVSLKWDHFPGCGQLDFLSAGRQNRDYSAAVCSLDWDDFYERLGGGRFFSAMRDDMKEKYDYVLIDSRTGLSDVADICTIELPDILTVCFTLSDQSIEGAANVAAQISRRYRNRDIRVLPVPMRIEDGEKEKLDVGRAMARTKFEGFPGKLTAEESAQYWASVEVPYKPFYAFEETLATFGDDPGSPTSLLASFERITRAVTGGEVTAMPPIADDVRLQYREAFRRQPSSPTQVFLSYAPEDRMWADWVEAVLTRAGFKVMPRSTVITGERGRGADEAQVEYELQTAPRALAILSSAYLNSPAARSIWKVMSATDAAGTHRRLIPLKVSESRITEPFTDHASVDLTHLDASEATAKLLWSVDRPIQQGGTPVSAAGEPRFPGRVPPVWNVQGRNQDFTGRAAVLETLRNKLAGGGAPVVLAQALYGLGGVGKTQVALEYAHRFMADYDLVWWVPSEHGDEISGSLAELAGKLDLRVGDNVTDAAAAALEELRRDTTRHWLLIFDNAESPKDLEPYLPTGSGHVLITSRNQAWAHSAEPLEVDVFTGDESVAHLMRHVPELDPDEAQQVAHALGHLPLAIEQAAAWLEQTGMPAQTYVEQLATQTAQILELNQPVDYPTPVGAAWNLSLQRLQERSPAGVRLLQLFAFMSAGPISMTLLYSDDMIRALLPYDQTLSELMLGRVIRDVGRFALIKVDQSNNSVQIHRLVQAVIRSQMTPDEVAETCHDVHEVLVGARPRQGETDDPENWLRYNLIWPHLTPSRAEECDESGARELLIDWVRYQWKRGEFDPALNLGRRLETLWTSKLGADDVQTLLLRFHIANVLRSKGQFSEARDLDSYVLERQRTVLGAEHPHTLMTAGGLASDLRSLGDFEQSLASDRETYRSWKEQFGDDHPRTLSAAHNLGVSLRLVGNYREARAIDEETLRRRREVLGADHPYTLYSAADLARDLRDAATVRESIELLRGTWGKYRTVLGDDMLDTLRTVTSLAVSLRKAGEQAEAMTLTHEAYERYTTRYGPSFLETLSCALNLACSHAALGDMDRARDLAAEVKDAYQADLGPNHPYTLIASNNLAIYLRGTGETARARELAERTGRAIRVRLGDSHPATLSAAVNLANCLVATGDLQAGESLQRSTITALRETLGDEHPDTLICRANLAINLREMGRHDEAEAIRSQVQILLGTVLGAGHPTVGQLEDWTLIDLDLDPEPT